MKIDNIIFDGCIQLLKSEEIKQEIKEIIKPLRSYILKEISIYLIFFIFFILLSFFLHLGILVLLIRYNKNIISK